MGLTWLEYAMAGSVVVIGIILSILIVSAFISLAQQIDAVFISASTGISAVEDAIGTLYTTSIEGFNFIGAAIVEGTNSTIALVVSAIDSLPQALETAGLFILETFVDIATTIGTALLNGVIAAGLGISEAASFLYQNFFSLSALQSMFNALKSMMSDLLGISF